MQGCHETLADSTPTTPIQTMCDYNQDCTRTPGLVVTVGPNEAVLDCCGAVVAPPFTVHDDLTGQMTSP